MSPKVPGHSSSKLTMFEEIAGNSRICSATLKWLATADDSSARWERQFLLTALGRLKNSQQRDVRHTCATGDETQTEALVCELIAHELLWRLRLAPA